MRRSSWFGRSFFPVLAAVALGSALPSRADKTLTLQFTPKENVTANVPKMVLCEGIANGDAHQWGRSFSAENYNEQVSDALKRTYANLLSDEGFQKAWTGSASVAAPSPAPAAITPAALKESILKMQAQGVAIDIVEGYVRGVKVDPPLSPDDIVDWKAAGIPDPVVKAAVSR